MWRGGSACTCSEPRRWFRAGSLFEASEAAHRQPDEPALRPNVYLDRFDHFVYAGSATDGGRAPSRGRGGAGWRTKATVAGRGFRHLFCASRFRWRRPPHRGCPITCGIVGAGPPATGPAGSSPAAAAMAPARVKVGRSGRASSSSSTSPSVQRRPMRRRDLEHACPVRAGGEEAARAPLGRIGAKGRRRASGESSRRGSGGPHSTDPGRAVVNLMADVL